MRFVLVSIMISGIALWCCGDWIAWFLSFPRWGSVGDGYSYTSGWIRCRSLGGRFAYIYLVVLGLLDGENSFMRSVNHSIEY